MADPLSVMGSIVGLISLGIQVTQSLVVFYTAYKNQDSELVGTIEKLDSLLIILQSLKKALSNRKFEVDERHLIKKIQTSLENCDELIHELQDECQRFSKDTSSGIIAAVKVAGRKAAYPFRQSTLQKLDEDISELRDNLSIALGVLQLKDNKMIQEDVADVKSLLNLLRTIQISDSIRNWLKAPDSTADHNAACAKRHPGTGAWFVKSSEFETWLTKENSFLWLNGFAGTGKSVLASTAIQYAFRHRRSSSSIGIAFFYFTFNDESKQNESAMLRALLVQLSGQLRDSHSTLARLYDSFQPGIPPSSHLADCLRQSVRRFHHVYIILDALDEAPPSKAREEVLNTIEMMQNWEIDGLHLLVTSRELPDIRRFLNFSFDQEVKMRNAEIDNDIRCVISSRLHEDRRLKKWLPYLSKIEEKLAKGAQGFFRWVECQLESLKSCPLSEHYLDSWLNLLPESLDETYERILCSIEDRFIEDARRILTLLCFAARPLSVLELIEGLAVEINPPRLNTKRRLQDADDVLGICLGLIDFDMSNISEQKTQTVRIAHFSVQEYLESKRIQHSKAAIFSLSSASGHAEIAQVCLIYWLEPGLAVTNLNNRLLDTYQLAEFAAMFWYDHYKSAENKIFQLENLILKLFQRQNGPFLTWIHLLDYKYNFGEFLWVSNKSPVYYASLLGLDQVLEELFFPKQRGDVMTYNFPQTSTSQNNDPNVKGGFYGHPLGAASSQGYERIVELLIRKGADINAGGGYYTDALHAASKEGHEKIVRLLIENGADINAQDGRALGDAAKEGHENIVRLLIENGADINARDGWALSDAAAEGHENIVRLLIENGAGINADNGSALAYSAWEGHENIVRLLIENGADINAQDGSALGGAAVGGHENVVRALIEKGAEVNDQDGFALQSASARGHEKIVRLLIENGVDIKAQGGRHGTALQAASSNGHETIVRLLIDDGADINAQVKRQYGNALVAASGEGYENIVQLLIENGADINAQGGQRYGNALQAASEEGHENILRLLIKNGADVMVQGGKYGNALQIASERGHEKIVRLLIEKGADI